MNYFSVFAACFGAVFAYDFLKEFATYLAIKVEQKKDSDFN